MWRHLASSNQSDTCATQCNCATSSFECAILKGDQWSGVICDEVKNLCVMLDDCDITLANVSLMRIFEYKSDFPIDLQAKLCETLILLTNSACLLI